MTDWPFDPPISPMEAKVRESLPEGEWAYEPKWDGFRSLAWSDPIRLDSRNQKPLLRYFPELAGSLEALPAGTVVDGEVVVVTGDRLDFDALQNRLHPAESRVNMLAEETPARLVAFDLLAHLGDDLRQRPFSERRDALESLIPGLPGPWSLTPSTTDREEASRWFREFEAAGCDGIVAKRLDGPYVEGKRDMIKVKHRRTVDCVVGGYRVHKDGKGIGSILLGLYDGDELHFIGHCSGFPDHDRAELLARFEELRSDDSFGPEGEVRRPGGESRWSAGKDLSWVPVEPGVVVEVSYDQLTGDRFRHATRFERWRPDKDAGQCTLDQLERPDGPGFERVVGA
ncbi:MAG TPA: ATP-dependent DNA ligase [Acidimicrobiia bacterium]|nr:ATP-dependent DNA ligase [Acidimicrobiia bacterium]